MGDPGSWLIVGMVFLVLPLATRPSVSRLLRARADRINEWAKEREARAARMDPDQERLWQWSRRRRLCAAIERIRVLLATDEWMSATRQLGNRLAYEQLLDELRRTPEVFPAGADVFAADPALATAPRRPVRSRRRSEPAEWDDREFAVGWSATSAGSPTMIGGQLGSAAVEVIEIGWRRR